LISIKNSFSNCSSCDLLEAPSCILETNCEDDLKKVDIIFIAENPGKDEVKVGHPLVGRAGKMFRKYFQKYGLNKLNYLLTNTVLCQTINDDGTTGNPEQHVIERCKVNCMEIIKTCDPKLVVLMGSSPMSAFGFGKAGITVIHEKGEVLEWEGYKFKVIVHPSFVNRNLSTWEPKFAEALANIAEMMGGKHINIKAQSTGTKKLGKGIYRYQIPQKFYTDEYRLVDIQFLNKTQQVLYIFRDKNNNKIYHKESDHYVCYHIPKGMDAKKMVPYDDLQQIEINYKDRYNLDPDITYEGDLKITVKHAIDYYHFNQGEPKKIYNNIMFFDIEVDTGDERVFPRPIESLFPINMITTILNGHSICYVVDNKVKPFTKKEVDELKLFPNEKAMMLQFIKDFKKSEPDFIAGWNAIAFDLEYIFNRLPKIGIQQSSMTQFGEFYVEGARYICNIPGCVAVDQDFFYKTFTFTKMENYKLGFIAQHELGITKIELPLPFNEMYWKRPNLTVDYNIRDTKLLEQLENKLAHINLMNELRIICNTTFDSVTPMGQVDSLMVSYLKEKGIASKNSNPHIKKERYPGAYVLEPDPGTYDWITDFDFASLYPSIMITYNIGVNTFVMKTKDPHLGYDLTYYPDKLPEDIEMIIDPLNKNKLVICKRDDLLKKIKDDKLVFTINGCFFVPHKKEFSVFGEVVDMLMKTRKSYKGKMFNAIEKKIEDDEKFFYTRQLVYKVLANTLYGVVANKSFRFYDNSLAAAVTLSGQEALKTSIIHGDAFMRHLNTGKKLVTPPMVTKEEMFADPDEQPTLYKLPNIPREYIVTGDTDSIFCCFESFGDNLEVGDIHKWCAQIEDFLNENKMIEMVNLHQVDLDFNRLKLKNELVISRGLFLAKKRYAIRVINNEGKDVDKINYMGVEIKRSDYPSKSKEFLSELSEMILKSKEVSLRKLYDFINRKELEFKELIMGGSKGIARPVSWGKKLEDYKTLPQAVKAMQAWNKIMYNIHKTGNKAYMFWVSGIDLDKAPVEVRENYHRYIKDGNKLEVIAIPDEEEKLPPYFIINKNAALKFCFQDRYNLMMKPLGEVKKKESAVLTF
jgi:uracil-DNA glycosylase family 4